MTAVRLPDPPSVMPALDVDPGVVEDCGVRLRAVCARLDDLGSFVAGPAGLPGWTGASAAAYRSVSASIGRGADALSLALRRVATRLLEHADTLAVLEQQHLDLVHRSGVLVAGVEGLRRDVAAATPDRIVELAPVLQARSDTVAGHVASYERHRQRWLDALLVEEREMVLALRPLTLEQVERRHGGRSDPADDALATLPPPGTPAVGVRAWWRILSPSERDALLVAAPGVLGNLAGIPARVRHQANSVRLRRDLAGLALLRERGSLTDAEARLLRNAEAASAALDRARRSRDPRTGEQLPVLLYLYDPGAFGGDGALAVAVGDPGSADDVSVLVPGMRTDAADIGALVDDATAVHDAAREADGETTHAALAWIGYDAPDNVPVLDGLSADVVRVVDEGLAERGGERLAEAVDGLRAERIGSPSDLTVIGHSYGSTTVGHAASGPGLAVDDLVVVGSPGLGGGVESVDDLAIGDADVWVGANSLDPVPHLAQRGAVGAGGLLGTVLGVGLGHDPATGDFGATRFRAEAPLTGPGDLLDAHGGYFDHDSESLHSIARIVTGHDEQVARAEGVHDAWWRPPVDPELGRTPSTPTTRLP